MNRRNYQWKEEGSKISELICKVLPLFAQLGRGTAVTRNTNIMIECKMKIFYLLSPTRQIHTQIALE